MGKGATVNMMKYEESEDEEETVVRDSDCFERGARMDSFAAVLTALSRSSMYKLSLVSQEE
jgi:hypothetical protein